MRWAGRVARVGRRRDAYSVLVQKERCHLEDNGVDGNTILNWIFKESVGRACFIDLAQERDKWRPLVKAVINLQAP
jgi:hypothetical protein